MTPTDHFSLFQLAPRFALDVDALEHAYRQVQARVHPDRFAAASGAEKRVAMQWATRANEAFATLKSPVRRAAYLCEINGVPVGAEVNTAMPPGFLMQQLEWREALDAASAAADAARLEALTAEVTEARTEALAQLEDAIDTRRDFAGAAALVRELMFIDKFASEIEAAAESLRVRGAA